VRLSRSRSRSQPFDSLTASASIITIESRGEVRESKPLAHSLPTGLRCVLPFHSNIFAYDGKDERARKSEADKGAPAASAYEDSSISPLLDYTQLYRQFADPQDTMLSFPVCEDKAEPCHVIY
jgi:hypothetical protein